MLKPELWQLVKRKRSRYKHYICDEMAEARGHRVLRLPPYHSELNPIELIWAQLKGYIATKNTSYNLKAVRELLNEAFAAVNVERWRECCRHVVEVEKALGQMDNLKESITPVIVTDTTNTDTSNSSSSSE